MSTAAKSILSKIRFVSAGAGSGKTTRLTELLEDRLTHGGVSPSRVIAVTFTRDAAAELVQRVRQRLIDVGKPEIAHAMESARIGTVHAVCAQILKRYCYENGSSPRQDVIDESRQEQVYARVVASGMSGGEWLEIMGACQALGIAPDDFKADLIRIGSLARENGMGPAEVLAAIQPSIDEIDSLLGAVCTVHPAQGLKDAFDQFILLEPTVPTSPAGAASKYEKVRTVLSKLNPKLGGGSGLEWREWLWLSNFKLGTKKSHVAH